MMVDVWVRGVHVAPLFLLRLACPGAKQRDGGTSQSSTLLALKKCLCLISVDAGGVRYCMLTLALFFTSGFGLGAWLMNHEDASLRSGVGHELDYVLVCPCADYGILDNDPAYRHRRTSLAVGMENIGLPWRWYHIHWQHLHPEDYSC